ncbi:MAG: hypothetical protein KZQ57_09830 [gamma proteobacterium symbiont of Lucinoma myriamae]|nr:hypothetical protein [gamma proteobacterium symbiont of Lucinoma myriamae]
MNKSLFLSILLFFITINISYASDKYTEGTVKTQHPFGNFLNYDGVKVLRYLTVNSFCIDEKRFYNKEKCERIADRTYRKVKNDLRINATLEDLKSSSFAKTAMVVEKEEKKYMREQRSKLPLGVKGEMQYLNTIFLPASKRQDEALKSIKK